METIKIPSRSLVILVAPAGAGKSSFAAKYFRPTEIVSSDWCRALVSDDENDQTCSKLAFDVFYSIIEARLKYGRFVVADATNLNPARRLELRQMAQKYDAKVVVIRMAATLEQCIAQNLRRTRQVSEHAIRSHYERYEETKLSLPNEGYDAIYVARPYESYSIIVGEKQPIEAPGFDIIGDVHGCIYELREMLVKLGYEVSGEGGLTWRHPAGRKLAFVGDFVDRGPNSYLTLLLVSHLVGMGTAYAVPGNHDNKLWRFLKGNNVKTAHGLAETIQQIEAQGPHNKGRFRDFLGSLPHQLRLRVPGQPDVIVCHAGIPREMVDRDDKAARAHCLYGEVEGLSDEGAPIRSGRFYKTWTPGADDPILVHGHTVVPSPFPELYVNVMNIDQGCVFGGKLTALRYPEIEIVQVTPERVYNDRGGLTFSDADVDKVAQAEDVKNFLINRLEKVG